MRLILLLLCVWACMGRLHAADLAHRTPAPPETEEEEHWRRYFGPVTAAEIEVFPDWRAERRKQYKEIEGSEAISVMEMTMSGNTEWYSRRMLEMAERKRYENAAKVPQPEPLNPHTPEAQVVIAKIKAAYAKLDNYHEKVRIWEFNHGWDSKPGVNTEVYENGFLTKRTMWSNQNVYDGELWYSRALGTRARVDISRQWAKAEANIWMDNGCVLQLNRELVRRNVEAFHLEKDCNNKAAVFLPPSTRYDGVIGHHGIAAQLLISEDYAFPQTGDQCRVIDQGILFCLRTNNAGLRMATTIQYDVATYLIAHIRWDGEGAFRGLAEYALVDAHTQIPSDSLRYEVPVEATLWLTKQQAELDAFREKEAAESRKRLAKASPTGEAPLGTNIPDSIALPLLVAMQHESNAELKAFARECSQTAIADIATWKSVRGKTDPVTGKPWSRIFEECRMEMTSPIVYRTPPVFAPCPDWIRTCEEQLL